MPRPRHKLQAHVNSESLQNRCQPQAAYRLASTLEGLGIDVTLEFVAGAGHSDSEPGLVDAMVRATDSLAKELLQ